MRVGVSSGYVEVNVEEKNKNTTLLLSTRKKNPDYLLVSRGK